MVKADGLFSEDQIATVSSDPGVTDIRMDFGLLSKSTYGLESIIVTTNADGDVAAVEDPDNDRLWHAVVYEDEIQSIIARFASPGSSNYWVRPLDDPAATAPFDLSVDGMEYLIETEHYDSTSMVFNLRIVNGFLTRSGYIKDRDGNPLEGVVVTLSEQTASGSPRVYTAATDEDGFYTIGELYPAAYQLTIVEQGYKDHTETKDLTAAVPGGSEIWEDIVLAVKDSGLSGEEDRPSGDQDRLEEEDRPADDRDRVVYKVIVGQKEEKANPTTGGAPKE